MLRGGTNGDEREGRMKMVWGVEEGCENRGVK